MAWNGVQAEDTCANDRASVAWNGWSESVALQYQDHLLFVLLSGTLVTSPSRMWKLRLEEVCHLPDGTWPVQGRSGTQI